MNEAHEQWLLDHDRAMAKHAKDMAEIRAVMLEVVQLMARLLDRNEGKGR